MLAAQGDETNKGMTFEQLASWHSFRFVSEKIRCGSVRVSMLAAQYTPRDKCTTDEQLGRRLLATRVWRDLVLQTPLRLNFPMGPGTLSTRRDTQCFIWYRALLKLLIVRCLVTVTGAREDMLTVGRSGADDPSDC
jgi:hypothetical protein